jgi:hypothetical protein
MNDGFRRPPGLAAVCHAIGRFCDTGQGGRDATAGSKPSRPDQRMVPDSSEETVPFTGSPALLMIDDL